MIICSDKEGCDLVHKAQSELLSQLPKASVIVVFRFDCKHKWPLVRDTRVSVLGRTADGKSSVRSWELSETEGEVTANQYMYADLETRYSGISQRVVEAESEKKTIIYSPRNGKLKLILYREKVRICIGRYRTRSGTFDDVIVELDNKDLPNVQIGDSRLLPINRGHVFGHFPEGKQLVKFYAAGIRFRQSERDKKGLAIVEGPKGSALWSLPADRLLSSLEKMTVAAMAAQHANPNSEPMQTVYADMSMKYFEASEDWWSPLVTEDIVADGMPEAERWGDRILVPRKYVRQEYRGTFNWRWSRDTLTAHDNLFVLPVMDEPEHGDIQLGLFSLRLPVDVSLFEQV